MSLLRCPECAREVSSKAVTCPGCGAPIAGAGSVASKEFHGRGEGVFMKSMNCGCVVALLLAAAFVVLLVVANVTKK